MSRKKFYVPLATMTVFFVVALGAIAVADVFSPDNDVFSSGNQATVNLTAAPGATVNTAAQLVVNYQGSKHLTPSTTVTFSVNASQTTLPSGYTVSALTATVPANWNDTTDTFVGGSSSISFTAPNTAGSYSYSVKWDDADTCNSTGDCLTGGNAFTVNLIVSTPTPSCTGPTVTTNPSNDTVTYGHNASFSAAASGSPAPTVQWQVNTGSGWSDLSGGTSTPLNITAPTVAISGNQYRAVFTSTCGSATTSAATLTVNKADQTITITTHAPASKVYGGSFTVAATGGGSGNPVTFSSTGGCSNVGDTFTMTSGTNACVVHYNQAGGANYNDAPELTETVNANKADQAITITTHAPASKVYGGSFTVAATGGGSGNPVTFSSTGGCSNVGDTFTMTSGTNACVVHYNQAGGANYNDAPELTETVNANKADQTITFDVLVGKTYGDTDFTVSAVASSGLAVSFAASSDCTVTGDTVHITGAGSCTVTASQAGNGNYNPAPDVLRTFSIAKANATCSVTPYSATYDGDPHTATGSCTGVEGGSLAGLDLSGTTHTAAGDYPSDAWTFTDSTGNYNNASGTVHDSIAKANATCSVTPYSATYDGDPHTATGSCTGVEGGSLAGLDLSGTTHTAAGDYPSDAWTFTDSTGNYNNASGTVHDSIAKATLTVTADNKTKILNAPNPSFTFQITGFKAGENASVLTTQPTCTSAATQTSPVGSYDITCSGAAATNYNFTYVKGTLTINYNWTGFFQPVDNNGVFNVVKAGSAIPIKFNLGGNQGLNIFQSGYPKSARVTCNTTAPQDLIEGTVTAGNSSLTYDTTAQQYVYVWKTDKAWAGTCRVFDLGLIDGTTHTAYFNFTR